LSEDVSSPKIQSIVYELLQFIQKNSTSVSLDKPCINVLIETYSNDYIKNMTDGKYGVSASKDGVVHFPAIPVILMKII
jgi:hypothetical protein